MWPLFMHHYLTIVAPMARKNKIEKNAPNALSTINARFTRDADLPCNNGMSGGSMKSFVPDRKTVKLKVSAYHNRLPLFKRATGGHSLVPRPAQRQKSIKNAMVIEDPARGLSGLLP